MIYIVYIYRHRSVYIDKTPKKSRWCPRAARPWRATRGLAATHRGRRRRRRRRRWRWGWRRHRRERRVAVGGRRRRRRRARRRRRVGGAGRVFVRARRTLLRRPSRGLATTRTTTTTTTTVVTMGAVGAEGGVRLRRRLCRLRRRLCRLCRRGEGRDAGMGCGTRKRAGRTARRRNG